MTEQGLREYIPFFLSFVDEGRLCDGYSSVFEYSLRDRSSVLNVGRSVLDGQSHSSGGAANSGEAANGGKATVEVVRQIHIVIGSVTLALSLGP